MFSLDIEVLVTHGGNGRIFDYAIEHRQELGDVLIDSINTLYPERDSKTPYVEKKN